MESCFSLRCIGLLMSKEFHSQKETLPLSIPMLSLLGGKKLRPWRFTELIFKSSKVDFLNVSSVCLRLLLLLSTSIKLSVRRLLSCWPNIPYLWILSRSRFAWYGAQAVKNHFNSLPMPHMLLRSSLGLLLERSMALLSLAYLTIEASCLMVLAGEFMCRWIGNLVKIATRLSSATNVQGHRGLPIHFCKMVKTFTSSFKRTKSSHYPYIKVHYFAALPF